MRLYQLSESVLFTKHVNTYKTFSTDSFCLSSKWLIRKIWNLLQSNVILLIKFTKGWHVNFLSLYVVIGGVATIQTLYDGNKSNPAWS